MRGRCLRGCRDRLLSAPWSSPSFWASLEGGAALPSNLSPVELLQLGYTQAWQVCFADRCGTYSPHGIGCTRMRPSVTVWGGTLARSGPNPPGYSQYGFESGVLLLNRP